MHHHNNESLGSFFYFWVIPFGLLLCLYFYAVYRTNQTYRKWPIYRTVLFSVGLLTVGVAIIGPIAEQAHTSFVFHMYSHLLLGMLGPLLIALSAPITLLLRTIPVKHARQVSKLLKSNYVQIIGHPIMAGVLNLGGLWILYTTPIFESMHHSWLLAFIIHVHLFLAGYLLTTSIIYIDPTPHRTSFKLRSVVMILYMAGHGILSKWVFANPPSGVSIQEAELGSMTMYYGGDFVDIIIVIILWSQFYKTWVNKRLPDVRINLN